MSRAEKALVVVAVLLALLGLGFYAVQGAGWYRIATEAR